MSSAFHPYSTSGAGPVKGAAPVSAGRGATPPTGPNGGARKSPVRRWWSAAVRAWAASRSAAGAERGSAPRWAAKSLPISLASAGVRVAMDSGGLCRITRPKSPQASGMRSTRGLGADRAGPRCGLLGRHGARPGEAERCGVTDGAGADRPGGVHALPAVSGAMSANRAPKSACPTPSLRCTAGEVRPILRPAGRRPSASERSTYSRCTAYAAATSSSGRSVPLRSDARDRAPGRARGLRGGVRGTHPRP